MKWEKSVEKYQQGSPHELCFIKLSLKIYISDANKYTIQTDDKKKCVPYEAKINIFSKKKKICLPILC